MPWTSLTLQVTTPLFNGGADQATGQTTGQDADRDAGETAGRDAVRVASIRGAMRFWFRALAGCAVGPHLDLLTALEHRVFGSTDAASPLVLRIPTQPGVRETSRQHDFLLRRDAARWIVYLLGQGHGDLRTLKLNRPYVAPGETFTLDVRFRHHRGTGEDEATAVEALALTALWLTCTYGGVGARTRRGFGGVRIGGVEGALPEGWTADALRTPSLGFYESITCLDPATPLAASRTHLGTLLAPDQRDRVTWDDWPHLPAYPVLSTTRTRAGLAADEFRSWEQVLAYAGEQLRHFRASRANTSADANYEPKIKTPEWEDVIHGNATRFPLGALGLPVVYKGNKTVDVRGGGGKPMRRASPLWLRPVGEGSSWRLLSFAFLGEFLPGPNAPTVTVDRKRLQVTAADVDHLTRQWITTLATGKSFLDHART